MGKIGDEEIRLFCNDNMESVIGNSQATTKLSPKGYPIYPLMR